MKLGLAAIVVGVVSTLVVVTHPHAVYGFSVAVSNFLLGH